MILHNVILIYISIRLYSIQGSKTGTTLAKNEAAEVMTKIKKFFYDHNFLRQANKDENEETVMLLEWIINDTGNSSYIDAT